MSARDVELAHVAALGVEAYHALIAGPTPLGSKAAMQAFGDHLDALIATLPDATRG